MVGVVGSSPIAPTRNGNEIKHLRVLFFCLFIRILVWRSLGLKPTDNGMVAHYSIGADKPAVQYVGVHDVDACQCGNGCAWFQAGGYQLSLRFGRVRSVRSPGWMPWGFCVFEYRVHD